MWSTKLQDINPAGKKYMYGIFFLSKIDKIYIYKYKYTS